MVTTTRDVSMRLAEATRLAVKPGTENIRWSLVNLDPDGNAYPVTRRDARTLTVEGPFPKGRYVVQLAFGNIPTIPGNAGVFMEGVAIDAEYPPDEGGGCAVGGGAGRGGGAAALLLALAALRFTSRRTSRPCRGSRSSR
jgi:hypothetical protein